MSRWFGFEFRIHWPENEACKWWVDIFIADCILRDVLSANRLEIALWRIHRRAKRDASGHKLTFDCYTDKHSAGTIEKSIRKTCAYRILERNQLLRECLHIVDRGPEVEALTNDTGWPAELRKAWPYYIQGVSELLLNLIEQLKSHISDFPDASRCDAEIKEIATAYQDLDEKVTQVWQRYGNNAFFHHLSSFFAYKPLMLYPTFHGLLASF